MNVNTDPIRSTRNKGAPSQSLGPASPSHQHTKSHQVVTHSTQSGKKSLQEDQALSMMSDAFRQRAQERFYEEALSKIQAQTPPPQESSRMARGVASQNNRTAEQNHLKVPSTTDHYRQAHAASTQAGSTVNHTKNHSSHHQHLRQYLTPHSHSSRENDVHHRPRADSASSAGGVPHNHLRHRKSTRSLRSSCGSSSNPERDDRAFVYPCHAFKQFVLTLKEGKIDLNELGKQPEKLREAMNKSSDLGRAYQKMQDRVQQDVNHSQRLSVSSIKQIESVNRLTYGAKCAANPCRSGSRGSDSHINDSIHQRHPSFARDSHQHSPAHEHYYQHNHSPSTFGKHAKFPTNFGSTAKAPLREPIIEVESHQNSPANSPQNRLYNTPGQPSHDFRTQRRLGDNNKTPAPLTNPNSRYPIATHGGSHFPQMNRNRSSTDNLDLEANSDGLNPWNLVSNLLPHRGSKNTQSGAISSQDSKPATGSELSSAKKQHPTQNNSSGKKKHKPSASMCVPAVPQQHASERHMPNKHPGSAQQYVDPNSYKTAPQKTQGIVGSGQKPKNSHLIDASQPPHGSSAKKERKTPNAQRRGDHTYHPDDLMSSQHLERPITNMPVREPQQQVPQYLSSSGSLTGPNSKYTPIYGKGQFNPNQRGSLNPQNPQTTAENPNIGKQLQLTLMPSGDIHLPRDGPDFNPSRPTRSSRETTQHGPFVDHQPSQYPPRGIEIDPRTPPTEQPIRSLEGTPQKGKGSRDPFPAALYGRPGAGTAQMMSPVDQYGGRPSLPFSSGGQLPTRHSMTGRTPASNTPQVPQSANSVQAGPSKKDRLVQQDPYAPVVNPYSPFSKNEQNPKASYFDDGRHSRPDLHESSAEQDNESYQTDDVGRILNSNNQAFRQSQQFTTIQGLQSPGLPTHPFYGEGNRYGGEDTLMNQASPVFNHAGLPMETTPTGAMRHPAGYSPNSFANRGKRQNVGGVSTPGGHSVDRVVGKWDAPIPDPRQSHGKSNQKQQQPGSRGQQSYDSPQRSVVVPIENPLGKLVGDRSPDREDLIRADLIDPRSQNPFTIKRQSSVGDGLQQAAGTISPIPVDFYPEHHRSTASLLEPSTSGVGNVVGNARNGSGKKRRLNNPSIPNLSNLVSADPSRDENGDSRSRKTPISGLSQMKERQKFGKHKKFSPTDLGDNNEFNQGADEDDEIQDLSGTTSYYTSQLTPGPRNMDITYQAKPYIVQPHTVRPEDYKLQSLDGPTGKQRSSTGISPTKFLKSSHPDRPLQNSAINPVDRSVNKSGVIGNTSRPIQRPSTDLKTPKKESPKGKRKSLDGTSFDQRQRSTTPKHQSLDLSQIKSPQIMGRQTPLGDTQTTMLPLNIIIEQANKRKDQIGAPGVFGGSFSGQPKNPRERTSRDQRRKKREQERMETHLGSSSGIRGGPVQDELMRHIMNDFNGLRESDVREITTLRNMPSDQTPRGEITDRKITHDPHQRLEQLDRKLNGSQQIGQKTPIPQSKTQFSPQHAHKEPNSTQKFADLKHKIDNLPNFRPDTLPSESYSGSKPTVPQFLNSRRSRQERSASSSGERQVEKKKTSDPMIGTPEKEQDLTLQNYIKQLSGTQRILSPREQAQASHFQKRKSNGLMDLPLPNNDSSKQPKKGQPLGEMIDEFDYKSKSPTNVGSRAREVMGVPQNPYSSAKPQNHLGSDINTPGKNGQSFTLNPYNQSVIQSATSLKGPARNDPRSFEDPKLFGALGPYGLPDQPLFISSSQHYPQPSSSGPHAQQRNTPITKQRSGGDPLYLGGASSPMSYHLEHQRSPSDRGLPGRPAMTPSSAAPMGQPLAAQKATQGGLQRQKLQIDDHMNGEAAEGLTQSQQSSKKGFGTFGANRSSMEERKRSPAKAEEFQVKDRESKMPPMRSVASSPEIHGQPNNRYVKQPSPQKVAKSSLMTPKSQQSLKSRSNKTQSRLRELGAKLHESIIYDGVTMKSIDYRLIHQLQSEAALVIQRQWRTHKLRRWPSKSGKKPRRPFKEEKKAPSDWQSEESIARTCKHGHTCERGTLTSPPQHKFCGIGTHCCCCSQFVSSLSQEKLQMFLASTMHSYMMLNCLMTDAQFSLHNHQGGGSCCHTHNQR